SARFPANAQYLGRTLGGGPGKLGGVRLGRPTEERQRGTRKDLWPKYFPRCPVARHFVCPKKSMSCAIANALTTGGGRRVGWVGFALGRKLLRFGNSYADESISGFGKDFWKERFPQRLRGVYRRGYSTNGVGRNDCVPL